MVIAGLEQFLGTQKAAYMVGAEWGLVARCHAADDIGADRPGAVRPGGAGPWLDGLPDEGLAGFAAIGSLDRLVSVVEEASEDEMRTARELGRTFLAGVNAFSRMADAVAGRDNASGMAGIGMVHGQARKGRLAVPIVLSILRSAELAPGLGRILDAIRTNVQPLEQQARELASLPSAEREDRLQNISNLPFIEQVRLKRLISPFAEAEG